MNIVGERSAGNPPATFDEGPQGETCGLLYRPREFNSHQEAEVAVEEAFKDYNRNRIHSALDYMTPYEYLDAWKSGKITVEPKVND
jgi:transposase InsO family protein